MIPWYMEDKRFKPGTVADIGSSIRLVLNQTEKYQNGKGWTGIDEYRLYLSLRTHKEDGAGDTLKRGVKVAVFKKCKSLKDAQDRANIWFSGWRGGLFDY